MLQQNVVIIEILIEYVYKIAYACHNMDLQQKMGEQKMEQELKAKVIRELQTRLGKEVYINDREWLEAKRETLNDIYANKLCLFTQATPEYFLNVMVEVLIVLKRVAA